MADDIDLAAVKAAFEELDRIPFAFSGKCTQARLMDENYPDGAVALTDDKGVVHVMMPRDVYEDILEYNSTKPARPLRPQASGHSSASSPLKIGSPT